MASELVDELLLQIDSSIFNMSIQDLKKLAYYLGLIDTSIDKLTRRLLIKLLRQKLETTVEKSKEPEIFLNEVQEFIGKDKDYVKSETNRQAPNVVASGQFMNLHDRALPQSNMATFIRTQDFKLQGQIGRPGQKDKMGYHTLLRQINSAVGEGKYTQNEIVQAVINAVQPENLKSYLETLLINEGLSVTNLLEIMAEYFQEAEPTSLFHQLYSAVQEKDETAQGFIIRCMSLKEKLLAIADDDGVSFDKNLVQCTFLKSVRTGLKDEGVSHVLLPYLKDTSITMVELLKQCRLAVTVENERQLKFKQKGGVGSKVGSVEKGQDKLEELVGLVNQMRVEVSQLKSKVAGQKESEGKRRVPSYMGCKTCKSEGKAEHCRHCWKCGADGHVSRNCQSLNKDGLPREMGER